MCLTYRYIGYIVVSALFFIFTYCIWSVCTYYSINPLGIRLGKTVFPMHLTYPSFLEGQQGIKASVKFNIESDKAMTEGAKLTLKDVEGILLTGVYRDGHLVSDSDIEEIQVGFKEAHPDYWGAIGTHDEALHQDQNRFYKALSVSLIRKNDGQCNNSHVKLLTEQWNREFYFPVSGDYPPSIVIRFQGGSYDEHTYNSPKLHVLSASEIQTQALNQINSLIAIILLIFGYIGALKLLIDVT
jgi:hypothetical protein